MMIYRNAKILLTVSCVLLSLMGCGSVLSSLETTKNIKKDNQGKLQCPTQSEDNCWVRSLQLISQCLPSSINGELTSDRRFCQNRQGLIVHFLNPYDLKPKSDTIEFDVYNREFKCFHIKKQGDNLAITNSPYGDIRLEILDAQTGAMSISCLFGESILINSKTVSENCFLQKAKALQDWPQALFSFKEDTNNRNFLFFMEGLGLGQEPIFNCSEGK